MIAESRGEWVILFIETFWEWDSLKKNDNGEEWDSWDSLDNYKGLQYRGFFFYFITGLF